MMKDASGIRHAARRNDDGGASLRIQCPRFFRSRADAQLRHLRQAAAVLRQQLDRRLVKLLHVLHEHARSSNRHGAVQNNGHILHAPFLPKLIKIIEQGLRAPNGKGRNDEIAAALHRILHSFQKSRFPIVELMQTIAVCRLKQQIIRALDERGIFDDGLIGLPQVAGKHELCRFPVFFHIHFHDGRANDMTGITKTHFDVIFHMKQFVVRFRDKMLQRRFCVFHRIERLNQRIAAALNLAVQNLRIVLLYMGGIRQHDMRQF